jgi:hypothetical protein
MPYGQHMQQSEGWGQMADALATILGTLPTKKEKQDLEYRDLLMEQMRDELSNAPLKREAAQLGLEAGKQDLAGAKTRGATEQISLDRQKKVEELAAAYLDAVNKGDTNTQLSLITQLALNPTQESGRILSSLPTQGLGYGATPDWIEQMMGYVPEQMARELQGTPQGQDPGFLKYDAAESMRRMQATKAQQQASEGEVALRAQQLQTEYAQTAKTQYELEQARTPGMLSAAGYSMFKDNPEVAILSAQKGVKQLDEYVQGTFTLGAKSVTGLIDATMGVGSEEEVKDAGPTQRFRTKARAETVMEGIERMAGMGQVFVDMSGYEAAQTPEAKALEVDKIQAQMEDIIRDNTSEWNGSGPETDGMAYNDWVRVRARRALGEYFGFTAEGSVPVESTPKPSAKQVKGIWEKTYDSIAAGGQTAPSIPGGPTLTDPRVQQQAVSKLKNLPNVIAAEVVEGVARGRASGEWKTQATDPDTRYLYNLMDGNYTISWDQYNDTRKQILAYQDNGNLLQVYQSLATTGKAPGTGVPKAIAETVWAALSSTRNPSDLRSKAIEAGSWAMSPDSIKTVAFLKAYERLGVHVADRMSRNLTTYTPLGF